MLKQEIRDKIMEKCISLEEYGYNDLTWRREDVEELLSDIRNDEIGILGGDVYELSSTHLIPLSDNWFCDQGDQESDNEYFLRSKSESLKYIKNYPIQQGENILFSITFTEQVI